MKGFRNAMVKRYGEGGALSRGAKPKSTSGGLASSSSGMIAEGSGANPSSDMVMTPMAGKSGKAIPGKAKGLLSDKGKAVRSAFKR